MRARPQANGFSHLIAATPLLFSIYGCDDGKGEMPSADAGAAAGDDGGTGSGADAADGVDARVEPEEDAAAPTDDGGASTAAASAYALTADHTLSAIDPSTGEVLRGVKLSGLADDERVLGMDVRPRDGLLYVLTSAARLYTVDVDTGALSAVSTLTAASTDTSEPFSALVGQRFAVDFNPVADRLRVVSDAGQNLRIEVTAGATITDGAVDARATPVAAGYTQSFAAACRTQLFVVDAAAGALALQDPPNDGVLTAVGALGTLQGAPVALDVQTDASGANRAVLVTQADGSAALYDVSLSTGEASGMRPLSLADELVGFAFVQPEAAPSQARGELVGLGEDGSLVSFNRGAPGKPCTTAQVSGLSGGEQLLGIDVRPADGALYGLGSAGRIYTVDVATGAATLKSTLMAAASDTSSPFTTLASDADAVGFNPVPDRLRVITRSGQNLRIDVDTGAVITDVPSSSGTLSAAAYTNSVAGAKTTTLYALDTAADALVRVGSMPASGGACDGPSPDVGNPNCGVVTSVGSLTLSGDVGPVNGFDIDATSGVALAALTLGDAQSSTLYQIDLSTGAASLPRGTASGTIAGARLRGLVFADNPAPVTTSP